MYLNIEKENYKAKILIANMNQLFSLLESYRNIGFTCTIEQK